MPSKTKQGFTLIELLIVIAIIGILMGILIPTISMIRKNGKLTETKDLRNQITAALQEYQTAYREYPPSSIPKGAQKPLSELNDINVGIEFCVTYLATPYRGSSFLTPSDKMLTNTDADKVSTKFAPWSYESKELFEFRDPNGNPFIYINSLDYGQEMKVMNVKKETIKVKAYQSDKLGAYQNPKTFQLWAMPYKDEIVTNWE